MTRTKRSIRDCVRAVVVFTLATIYELVFKHVFGLRTFFGTNVTDLGPPVKLDLGYANVLQMKLILFSRYFFRSQTLFSGWHRRVEQAMVTRLRRSRIDTSKLVTRLTEIRAGEITADQFFKEYVMKGRPIVIRGGAAASEACRTWDVEFFRSRYGDVPVQILDPGKEEFSGPLREVLDSQGTDRRLYVLGTINLLRDHKELIDQMGVLSYRKHMTRLPISYVGSQLFLGVHHKSGSGWHCATGSNLFFMVRGKKRWTFASAEYTWFFHPLVNQTCQTLLSPMYLLLDRQYDLDYIRKYFPLFEFCPRQEVTLEPGDVLFNPAWNWHDVENLTEESIAVSSRWIQPLRVSHNRFVEWCMLLSGYLNRRRFQVLLNQSYTITDENTREIYRNQDDRSDFGRPGSFGRMRKRYGIDVLRPAYSAAEAREMQEAADV